MFGNIEKNGLNPKIRPNFEIRSKLRWFYDYND
jgi:hypothetical protein